MEGGWSVEAAMALLKFLPDDWIPQCVVVPKDNRATNLAFSGSTYMISSCHAWTQLLLYVVFRAHFPAKRACYVFGVICLPNQLAKEAMLITIG